MRASTPLLALILLMGTGCGQIIVAPMPVRLEAEQQQAMERGWAQFCAAGVDAERQVLLDAILARQAWHLGVDELTCKSEKSVGLHTVRMVARFDRTDPDSDRFEIRILGPFRIPLRSETFSRAEIEESCQTIGEQLLANTTASPEPPTPEELVRKERVALAEALFPVEVKSPAAP